MKLNYRAWANLEHRSARNAARPHDDTTDSELDAGGGGLFASVALRPRPPGVVSTTHSALNGSAFWTLVPALIRGLSHLSQLFSRLGHFQEAVYYADQVSKIVEAVHAKPLIIENLASTADLHVRGSLIDKARTAIMQAHNLSEGAKKTKVHVQLYCAQAKLHGLQGDVENEIAQYGVADQVLEVLTSPTIVDSIDCFDSTESSLEAKMSALSLLKKPGKKAKVVSQPKTRAPAKTTTHKKTKGDSQNPSLSSYASAECSELGCLRGNVLRLRASAMFLQQNVDAAIASLLLAEKYPMDTQGHVLQRLGVSKQLLQQALESMSRDSVFCVISESTISLPSVAVSGRRQQRAGDELSPVKATFSAIDRSPVKPQARAPSRSKKSSQFVGLLGGARDKLAEALKLATRHCPTSTVRALSLAMSNVTVLLGSAAGRTAAPIRPIMPIFYAGMGYFFPPLSVSWVYLS